VINFFFLYAVTGDYQEALDILISAGYKLLAGDRVYLTCKASSFYFAKGLFFKIHWKNNSIETVPGKNRNKLDGELLSRDIN